MNRFSLEVKVGIVVSVTVALIIAFLFFLGQYNPFTKSYRIKVMYNYAGGIEVGSVVRVAGVKMGKIDQIRFLEAGRVFEGEPVTISVRLQIDRRARHMIREDSRFFITNAGIIGEKYVEITPGSPVAAIIPDGASVRGIDPPRLDELISEAYEIFGKLSERLEAMSPEDKQKLRDLFDNLVTLSTSLSDLGAKSGQFMGMVEDTRKLVNDLDSIINPMVPASDEEKLALERRLKRAGEIIDHLSSVSSTLDQTLEGVTKASLERTVRKILQDEGITINVGTMVGKPSYPPLPPAPGSDGKSSQ